MKVMFFLFFGDSLWMKASTSIFFVSTSNVPSQLIVEKRYPSRKTLGKRWQQSSYSWSIRLN
jgi:hypothetical protein